MKRPLDIAFFGSSLVSAYWNGAATYYRGIIKALDALGHRVTFYEPDAYDRQKHRDIPDPSWAKVVVYSGTDEDEARRTVEEAARRCDVLVKASGVGVFDALLEAAVARAGGANERERETGADGEARPRPRTVFWDVDAPATLDRMRNDEGDAFRACAPRYDAVFTYGGGDPVVRGYASFGARECVPIYNALDPETHHPVTPDARFEADLALLANRLPDREARVDEYFFKAARARPDLRFLLGGSGWGDKALPPNVRYVGHVYTADHNAFNCTPRAVLNVARDSMAACGFSPATRVFEAAGAGACILTDAWEGIDLFLAPEKEILVANGGDEVAALLDATDREAARRIGEASRRRVLAQHTYARRALDVEAVLLRHLGGQADAARRPEALPRHAEVEELAP